jgi:hypothetical protein
LPLGEWGSWGEGPGQFQNALGIAMDEEGLVYVADYSGRVQIFKVSFD